MSMKIFTYDQFLKESEEQARKIETGDWVEVTFKQDNVYKFLPLNWKEKNMKEIEDMIKMDHQSVYSRRPNSHIGNINPDNFTEDQEVRSGQKMVGKVIKLKTKSIPQRLISLLKLDNEDDYFVSVDIPGYGILFGIELKGIDIVKTSKPQ